jgi:hypothetical protein
MVVFPPLIGENILADKSLAETLEQILNDEKNLKAAVFGKFL